MKKNLLFFYSFVILCFLFPLQNAFAICTGSSTVSTAGDPFTLGYTYEFSTTGTSVTVTFNLLDAKAGLIAYSRTNSPFSELGATLVSGQKYTYTYTGQTIGVNLDLSFKFAYAGGGGMAVTAIFPYTVGDNCSGAGILLSGSNSGAPVCSGTSVTLTAVHALSGTDYKWYKKEDGDIVFSLMGTTLVPTYNVSPTKLTEYKVEYASVTSNILSIDTLACSPTQECFGTITTDKTDALTAVIYDYSFSTIGNTVTSKIDFSNIKTGLTGWCTINGVKSAQLYSDGGAFKTIQFSDDFVIGQILTIQWEFGWVGEHMTTKTFTYTVGNDCYNVHMTASNNGETICIGNPVTLTGSSSLVGTDYTWYKKESGDIVWTAFATTAANTVNVLPSISTEYKVEYGGEESSITYIHAMVCCSEAAGKINLYKEDFGALASVCDRSNTSVVPVSVNLQYADNNLPDKFVNDGYYAVVADPACLAHGNTAGVPWFLSGTDHTGNVNGGMLFVNNGLQSATIFSKTIKNPCLNTTLEFSSWIANACRIEANCPLPVNLTFKVYGLKTGTWAEIPNSSIETGNLNYLASLTWFQRGTTFSSSDYDSLRVEITNNGSPGWGNDALIDDIALTACSPSVNLYTDAATFKTDTTVCNSDVVTLTPLAGYDLTTYFTTPNFLIQYSGDSINWTNILPVINIANPSWNIGADTLTTDTTYYRVIVGNSAATVLAVANGTYSAGACMLYTISNIASIYRPLFSIGVEDTITVCEGTNVPLAGTTNGIEWQWEDSSGNIIVPKSSNPVLKNYVLNATQDSVLYFRAFDLNGCSKIQKFTIETILRPTYTFLLGQTICEGKQVTLTLTLTGTQPFSFDYTDGITTDVITNYNSTTWTKLVSPTATTSYAIKNLQDSNCFAY